MGSDYAYFGLYEMNAYTQFYSANCQTVNRYTDYSGYGKKSKGPKRGGILTGIVGAQLVIKYDDGTKDTLKWANGDISFEYTKTIKGKTGKIGASDPNYNPKYFPAPKSQFWVKVKKGKIQAGKGMTVTLKFTSIKVEAKEIADGEAVVVKIKQNGQLGQPRLVCGGTMTVEEWNCATKCTIGPKDIDAKINVYISKVEGGGKDNRDTYPNNYIVSDKYVYKEHGSIERDVGKDENIGHVQCPSETGLKIGTPRSSRAAWSEAKKQRKTAIAEKGDTVTFKVQVTNTEKFPIYVQTVKLTGCFEHKRKMTIKYKDEDKDRTEVKEDAGDNDSYTTRILEDVKIPARGTKTFTCIVENVTTSVDSYKQRKYLQAKIGNIAREENGPIVAKGKNTSRDQFVFKRYYITIDKYISGDNIEGFDSAGFPKGGSDKYNPDLDASEDDGDSGGIDDDDTGDDAGEGEETDANVDAEEPAIGRTYLGSISSETLKVRGIIYNAVMEEGGGASGYYYYSGNYYFYDAQYLVMLPAYVSSEGGHLVVNDVSGAGSDGVEQVIYLNCDSDGNIIHGDDSDPKTFTNNLDGKKYYPVYDERYNPSSSDPGFNFVACYYSEDDDGVGKYYITNDLSPEAQGGDKDVADLPMKEVSLWHDSANLNLIRLDLNSEANTDDQVDPEETVEYNYLDVNSSGMPTGSPSATSSAWYPVYSKEDNTEIVCYYHQGYRQFYSKEGSNYEPIEAERDATGWYIKSEDEEGTSSGGEQQAKVYLEGDSYGGIVLRNSSEFETLTLSNGDVLEGPFNEVWDIAGENVIAYYHPGEHKYIFVSGSFAKEITIRGGNSGGFYFNEASLSAEADDTSDAEEEHETDTYHYPLAAVPSGSAHKRKQTDDAIKKVLPAKVDVGDEVTYKVVLYNTGNTQQDNEWLLNCTGNDHFGRRGSDYFKPGGVFVTVEDTLPKEYIESVSSMRVEFKVMAENEYGNGDAEPSSVSGDSGREFTKNISVSGGKFTIKDIYVPAGGSTVLTYKVKVKKTDGSAENKATIIETKNGNGRSFVDLNKAPEERKTSSDFFGKPGIDKEIPEDDVDISVNVTKVQHNSDTGTKKTFEGSVKEAYAEYGDRVEFEIKVKNTYTAEQSFNFECWEAYEPTDQDLATVTLRIELPEEIYQESNKYKILIDGKPYDIDTGQRTGVMWEFENKPKIEDNRIMIPQNRPCQTDYYHETVCGRWDCWTEHREIWQVDHTHYTKVGPSTTCQLTDNSTKVEIVNISNDKDVDISKLTLKATLSNIKYEHRYGFFYQETSTRHDDGQTSYHCCQQGDPYDVEFNYDGKYTGASKGGPSSNTGIHKLGGIQDKAVEGWTGGHITSQANYKMNDYSLKVDHYVNKYNGEMETYNRAHKFSTETGTYKVENNTKDKNYDDNPQMVEKYETMTLLTVATNVAPSTEEDESNTGSPGKYKTRVRPDIVHQTLDAGLKFIPGTVKIKKNNGQDITSMFNVTQVGNRMEYVVKQDDNSIATTLLLPGETIYYYVDVHVVESNMSLDTIRSTSVSIQLSNVNHQKPIDSEFNTDGQKKERIVYKKDELEQNNVCEQKSDTSSFKLKDLIIAGRVWVDGDRDGYKKNDKDVDKKDVHVLLYEVGKTEPLKDFWTRDDGTYTFDRQDKTKKYYVEFEYDGMFYKATEVYGGVSSGEADGAGNLDGSTGNYGVQWLQGHDDLTSTVPYTNKPEGEGPINGNTEYMTDSNAYEFDDVRNAYDANHQKIGFDWSYNEALTPIDKLEYTPDGHTSTLKEKEKPEGTRIMTARSFIKQSYSSSGVNSTDASNTNTIFLNKYNGYNRTTATPKPETEYLKYVNLGLVRREEVDLSIDADVYSVKTTVNGEEMQYVFDENEQNNGGDSENNNSSADSYSGNAYKLQNAYNLELYKSDYYYRYDNYYGQTDYYDQTVEDLMKYKSEASEENIEVTYRICVRNKKLVNDEPNVPSITDIPVQAALNEVVVYYDSKFKNDITGTTPVRIKDKGSGLWYTKDLPNVYARYSKNTNNVETEKDLNAVGVNEGDPNPRGTKELTVSETSRFSNNKQASEGESGDQGYSILHLSSNDLDGEYLSEGECLYIDITFIVRKDTIVPEDGQGNEYNKTELERTLDMFSQNELGLEMVAEIGGYTTKYHKDYAHKGLADQVAGLVDRDSNPSNVRKLNGGVDNYEDDTYAVGVKIGLRGEPDGGGDGGDGVRSLKGVVWEDARSTSVDKNSTGKQYIGNGVYKKDEDSTPSDGTVQVNSVLNPADAGGVTKDRPVAGVKVTLMEIAQTGTGDNTAYYEYPARYAYTWTDQYGVKHNKGDIVQFVTGTKTGNMYDGAAQGNAYEDGSYLFQNFITGYYIVRFDYGYDKNKPENIVYNGQDYKSTQYYNPENTGDHWNSYSKGDAYYQKSSGWQTDDIGVKSVVNNPEVDVKTEALSVNSDNSDDFYFNKVKEALQIDDRVSDAQDDEIRRLNVNAYSEVTTTTQAQVFSETVAFAPELIQNTAMYADSTIFYVNPENGKCEDRKIDYNSAKPWNLKNLDFGIEYRPEASIVLDKDISTIELVTTDGDTLLKLFFETDATGKRVINTTKSIGHENVQFIPNSGTDGKGKQGIVYINMDTDILEGAIMNVEYEFDATNHSEVDRINKNLNDIRFESGATSKGYKQEYEICATINEALTGEKNYSANKTASKALQLKYYEKQFAGEESKFTVESDKHKYLKYLKKPYQYNTSNGTGVRSDNLPTGSGSSMVGVTGGEYYGMYLGQTYYRGEVGNYDEVVDLKVDNLMDYLDNNLTFSATSNSTDNHLWSAKRSEELATVIDWSMASVKQGLVPSDVANKYYMYNVYEKYDDIGNIVKCYANNPSLLLDMNKRKEARTALVDFRKHIIYGELVDANDVKYDTKDRSNLLMSVDSNRIGNKADVSPGNKALSRFLATTKKVSPTNTAKSDKTTGEINLIASKVLSAVDLEAGTSLTYGNYAEVVQYRLLTGRRTKLPDDDIRGGLIAQGPPETPPDDMGRTDPDPEPGEDTPIGREPTDPPLDDPDPIGSNRLDPDSPEGTTPIGRKEITTDSGDFTEIITISPPTGLKQK